MDFECCHPPVNIMRNLDSKMVRYYHAVLRLELEEGRIYADDVKKVKTAYRKETISSGNSDICFSSPATRGAYVFLYCASFGSPTAYHFLQLLRGDKALLQKVTFQDTFHLCCLGGGPGTEIAAIAKILDELMPGCFSTRRKPLLIKATVIDIDSGWSVTAENLIRSLAQLVDTSLIRCELNFIEADLTGSLPKRVRDAIGEADLVTMVKFLSSIHGSRYKDRSEPMLQELIGCIKADGRLFFLDSSSNMHFEVFRSAMESFPDMAESYGPLTHDLYKMSVYSIAESVRLNEKYFGWQLPAVVTINYVSVWHRGASRNLVMRPTLTAAKENGKKTYQREIEKHFRKCLKFSLPRSEQTEDFPPECCCEGYRMFNTKSKRKRIVDTFEI